MPESESITGACEYLNCHFELFINNCSSIVSLLKIKGLGNMHLSAGVTTTLIDMINIYEIKLSGIIY